mgnify:FL=1
MYTIQVEYFYYNTPEYKINMDISFMYIQDAIDYILGMGCEPVDDYDYLPKGRYYLSHNEYARPVYSVMHEGEKTC